MPERKYTSHSAEYCTGMRTKHPIKDGMGVPMVISTNYVQQYNNSENKWKKELKALKKQNKILYSISNKYGSRREIKKIRKESFQEDWRLFR